MSDNGENQITNLSLRERGFLEKPVNDGIYEWKLVALEYTVENPCRRNIPLRATKPLYMVKRKTSPKRAPIIWKKIRQGVNLERSWLDKRCLSRHIYVNRPGPFGESGSKPCTAIKEIDCVLLENIQTTSDPGIDRVLSDNTQATSDPGMTATAFFQRKISSLHLKTWNRRDRSENIQATNENLELDRRKISSLQAKAW